jgi:hypothetical protein
MTTHDQAHPDEHGRGGVRGAINDLLGRGDRTDDDRRVEGERLDQERYDTGHDAASVGTSTSAGHDAASAGTSTSTGHDAGTVDPASTGRPVDDAYGTPAPHQGHPDATAGAAAPRGELFDDPAGTTVPGGARHRDVGPDAPGYDPTTAGDPRAGAQAQRQDAGRPDMGHPDTSQGIDEQPRAEHQRGDAGPAGSRTVDIGGAEAATAPVAAGRNDAGRDDAGRNYRAQQGDTGPNGSSATSAAGTPRPQGEDAEGRERLVSAERAESYGSRWDTVKGEFVDEPRQAVADADALVGELLAELQTLFTEQRHGIERNLDADETSTEDMRLALRRYRSFFDRLLSI